MNTGKRIYFGALIFVAAILFSGCNHGTDFFDGPSLVDRFGPFELRDSLKASQSTVDFSAGQTVFFEASFSKNIAWVLKLTGKESGSVKLIEGFDNELNAENAIWNGSTTELPLFRAEDVLAELIIPEEDSFTISTEVTVSGSRIYEGSLVTGFEEELGSRLFTGNFEFELDFPPSGVREDVAAGEGSKFFFLRGTDDVVVNFFAGLIRIFPETGETYYNLPTTVPENAYFNFFLYGEGDPHTLAVVTLFTDTNDNGVFNDGTDRGFQVDGDGNYPITFEGWRQFSLNLGDVGMTQEEAEKLIAVQVVLISDNNSQPNPPVPVSFGIDYMIFTANQPLEI